MSNPTLKAYLDAKKKPSRTLGAVERHLLTRPADDRSTLVLHPSEIVKDDWCLRESCFLLMGVEKKQDRPNLRLQNIFDEGHEYHRKWQARFADMGVLYGQWDHGEGTRKKWGKSSDINPKNRRYLEVPLVSSSAKYRISGKADGWLIGLGDPALLEVKSVGEGTLRVSGLIGQFGSAEEAWKQMNRPMIGFKQAMMYLELGHMTYEDFPNEVVFIYELKSNQAVKEFVAKRNPEMVADVFENAAKVVRAVRKGAPLPCNISEGGCSKCKGY